MTRVAAEALEALGEHFLNSPDFKVLLSALLAQLLIERVHLC